MADVELVVKIPEEVMEFIKNNGCLSVVYIDEVAKAIKNGTPLPKGHGRLIDEDKLIGKIHGVRSITAVLDASTIIEADNAESEE